MMKLPSKKRLALIVPAAVSAIFLLNVVPLQPFVINPSDRGNVRLFGIVQNEKPLLPGLHFKRFLEDVDRLQVSLTTVHVPSFVVGTVDNQEVTMDISISYVTPDSSVSHLLYDVGRTGSVDIEDQLLPVVKDRTGRILSGQNMGSVNKNRKVVQDTVEKAVRDAARRMFGIEIESLQIAAIKPSKAFIESNENAVRAKNEAVAAENTKKTKQFEADQAVIEAQGRADAVLLEAKAQAERIRVEGEGDAAKIKAAVDALGGDSRLYVRYVGALARLKWDGSSVPQVVTGSGSTTPVVIPLSK